MRSCFIFSTLNGFLNAAIYCCFRIQRTHWTHHPDRCRVHREFIFMFWTKREIYQLYDNFVLRVDFLCQKCSGCYYLLPIHPLPVWSIYDVPFTPVCVWFWRLKNTSVSFIKLTRSSHNCIHFDFRKCFAYSIMKSL